MAVINPREIVGKWRSGMVLDVHTVSSTYLGVNEFGHEIYDTKRSEIGELLYRLKYNADLAAAEEIVQTAAAFLEPYKAKFDLIVPVPPSGPRAVQPVITLAKGIGAALKIPVITCVSTTRDTTPLKGVQDLDRRNELLKGLHAVNSADTTGRSVLLFDDLFRSGATMNAITDLLMSDGKAVCVLAFAITRTRSKQ